MDWFPADDKPALEASLGAVRELAAHPGWKVFLRYLESQRKVHLTRLETCFEPNVVMELKGRMVALSFLETWPERFARDASAALLKIERKTNKETDDARRTAERNVKRGY
jgi:hypothetical protein